jgi:hypothetical protein
MCDKFCIIIQIGRNDKTWKAWFDTDAPEESPIPDGYGTSLDTFRKLLLIRYKKKKPGKWFAVTFIIFSHS